jgi:hypothetical protein
MTNNRKIANSLFNALRKENIFVTDVKFLSSYFIFYMGEDSVVHFHIKGLKGWKFGLWIDLTYEKQTMKCFAQYEQLIDKFKPSESVFLETISKYSLCSLIKNKDNNKWVYLDIIRMIKHIKNNPSIALIQELNFNPYLKDPLWKMYLDSKKTVYEDKLYKIKNHFTRDIIPYKRNRLAIKLIKAQKLPIIKDIVFKDLDDNDFGVVSTPRYEISFVFHRLAKSDEEQGRLMSEALVPFEKLLTKENTSIYYYVGRISRSTEWS